MAKSHVFSQVPQANIQRSVFNRSHDLKTTLDAGYLVPIYVDEVLPGDSFKLKATLFGRLNTPVTPAMDNLYLDTFFFAVPIRLIWDHWKEFNGEQKNPGDTTDYLIPQIGAPSNGFDEGSLEDYFGIPTKVSGFSVSALWHRAYNLVYNEWFRDENLQDSVEVPTGDGPDIYSTYRLLKRSKRHDYFTSALPWPQKGPGVEFPLSGDAPVIGSANVNIIGNGRAIGLKAWKDSGGQAEKFGLGVADNGYIFGSTDLYNKDRGAYGNKSTTGHLMKAWSLPPVSDIQGFSMTNEIGATGMYGQLAAGHTLRANFDNIAVVTINALREAFQMQRLYERDARGGSRYTEIVRSHFGVISPDARLQRPEYLGGGSQRININPVAQTSATDSTSPQGNLAAIGTVLSGHTGFSKSFTEHCVLIGLANVRADLTYQQGLNRMFSRQTRFDFYWPALSHLSEQAVLNKEIYMDGTAADEEVFGYQERYAEYRYKPSIITGKLRSNATGSLDIWHFAQQFASRPLLNASFIEENPPLDRVVAVPTEPDVLLDCHFSLKCARPMPVYSVPGMIDHF